MRIKHGHVGVWLLLCVSTLLLGGCLERQLTRDEVFDLLAQRQKDAISDGTEADQGGTDSEGSDAQSPGDGVADLGPGADLVELPPPSPNPGPARSTLAPGGGVSSDDGGRFLLRGAIRGFGTPTQSTSKSDDGRFQLFNTTY